MSPIAAAISRKVHGTALIGWIITQAVVTAVAYVVPQVQRLITRHELRSLEQAELAGRTKARVAMNDALHPVLQSLGRAATAAGARERRTSIDQAIPAVLATAAVLLGPDRSRACWFEYEAGPPKRLVPVAHHGRAGSPTSVFDEGTPNGDTALAMVLSSSNLICHDIHTDPPLGWDSEKRRDYATFISVSVVAGDTAFGMLTLDAPDAGGLTDDDLQMLRLFASALGVALALR
jgi:GAF domain-containing protein